MPLHPPIPFYSFINQRIFPLPLCAAFPDFRPAFPRNPGLPQLSNLLFSSPKTSFFNIFIIFLPQIFTYSFPSTSSFHFVWHTFPLFAAYFLSKICGFSPHLKSLLFNRRLVWSCILVLLS